MKILIIPFCLILLSGELAGQQNSTALRFLGFLNECNRDSLSTLITDDFRLTRSFASYKNDRDDFLGNYLNQSREYEGIFSVKKELNAGNPAQFIVEDKSKYLECLGVPTPEWLFKVTTSGDKVVLATLDTLPGYYRYEQLIKVKDQQFNFWLSEKYGIESVGLLTATPGLLMARVREYTGCR